jgi:serine/threonine protein kinase
VEHRITARQRWLVVSFANAQPTPQQGWKLHVSAHPGNSHAVLDRVLPVLRAHRVDFKVAASPQMLEILNAAAAGPSQIGKFITVYPPNDERAATIAENLHTATADMAGPRIPSDRRLHPGSLVHYRFGSFTGAALMQLADGRVASALISPAGTVEPDERPPVFAPPTWAVSPFPPFGDAMTTRPQVTLDSPYRALSLLSDTGRGSVWLGVDVARRRRCILKTGNGGSAVDLRREAAVLRSLSSGAGWPAIYDVVETADQIVLVMEDIDGVSLSEYVAAGAAYGTPLSGRQLIDLIDHLLDTVGALHGQGVVHRDLKASNILVTAEGSLRLIDFEHAARVGELAKTGGTRGYVSPQQRAGGAADLRDDIYAIGALLALMSTGAEPSRAPDHTNLLTRPLRLINPDIPLRLTSVIANCLHPDARLRTPDTAGVRAALADVADCCELDAGTVSVPAPRRSRCVSSDSSEPHPDKRAEQLVDALCERAVSAEGGLLTWISTAPGTFPVPYRQINNGVAGILIALAAGWTAFGQPRHRDTLVHGARWLARSAELPGAKVSGLYAGEAGVGAALLHVGCALDNDEFVAAAFDCARRLREHPFASADLFHGTAGRLRFLLMLYEREREVGVLADALDCAEELHRSVIRLDGDTAHWATANAGGDHLEVASYAHGTSGIADVLLDLFEVTSDPVHLELALQAARWVREQAVTTLADGSGLDWGKGGGASAACGATAPAESEHCSRTWLSSTSPSVPSTPPSVRPSLRPERRVPLLLGCATD